MANSSTIILASALCFLSFLNSAYCYDRFYVEGSVYCDTCRTQFITKLSHFLEGATVEVECKEMESGNVTLKKEAVTNASGGYCVEVEGDHQDDVCQVTLLKSSDPDCSDVDQSAFVNQAAKVSITRNNGIVSPVRTANPLGFLRKEILPKCAPILDDLKRLFSDNN